MLSTRLIVGDLRAEDEFMHQVTEDPSFNESMMFNFFDHTQGLGGFVRIGNRLNEGHAEVTLCVFLPSGEVLLQWAKPPIESNAGFDSAGLRFRVIEPVRRLEVEYRGDAVRLTDPLQMRDPGAAFRGNRSVPVSLALKVEGTGPMIGSASGKSEDSIIFLDGVGHYQQPIAARGTLRVGQHSWELSTYGVRDHSWGRRVWASIFRDRSLWITLGPDLSFICCKTWLDPAEPPDIMGCVIEQESVTPLRNVQVKSRFTAGTHYHSAVHLDLEDIRGRSFSLTGVVLSYVPLRHRAAGHETVFLGQAMTRFEYRGRVALGLTEYFDAQSACTALVELSERGAFAFD